MKKNYILYVCAAAALMFASCQKEGPAQAGQQVESSGLEVVTATSPQTKIMTQDGVNVLWEEAEAISLFGLKPTDNPEMPDAVLCTYNKIASSANDKATFVKDAADANYPTAVGEGNKYVAFYTKGASNTNKSRNLYTMYSLSKDVTAKNGGDFISSIMAASSENSEFQFKHIVSYVKFTVDENTTPFNKLIVSPVSESEYIVSRITIDFVSDLTSTVTALNTSTGKPYSQSSQVLNITTDNNAAFAPGTYYFAVNPSTYSEGLNFTFENAEGKQFEIAREGSVEMTPGCVADMGTIGTLQFEEVKKLELATVFEENGKKQGVVYWIDPDNTAKGKIVSVSTAEPIQWTTQSSVAGTDTSDGIKNFNTITGWDAYVEDANNYPAIKYCADLRESLGGNWYLPVLSEMQTIFSAYYGLPQYNSTDPRNMTTKAGFDTAFVALGETSTATLDGDDDADGVYDNAGFGNENGVAYWLSKVNSSGSKVQYVNFGVWSNANNGGDNSIKYYVRCIRDVELQ